MELDAKYGQKLFLLWHFERNLCSNPSCRSFIWFQIVFFICFSLLNQRTSAEPPFVPCIESSNGENWVQRELGHLLTTAVKEILLSKWNWHQFQSHFLLHLHTLSLFFYSCLRIRAFAKKDLTKRNWHQYHSRFLYIVSFADVSLFSFNKSTDRVGAIKIESLRCIGNIGHWNMLSPL